MAYVLDYTVIAAGLPYQSSGTSHRDALNHFIFNPPMRYGYHGGDYHTQDGEQIIVVGPTQEAYSERQRWVSRGQRLREQVVGGGKGVRTAQRNLAAHEAQREPKVDNVPITFTMRERVVFDALTTEQIEREDRFDELRGKIQEIGQGTKPVKLVLNKERQVPMGSIGIGVVETIYDEGVRINNKLIPWSDIDNVEPAPVEIPVTA